MASPKDHISEYPFSKAHCLSISDFHRMDIEALLALGEHYLDLSLQKSPKLDILAGKTLIRCTRLIISKSLMLCY